MSACRRAVKAGNGPNKRTVYFIHGVTSKGRLINQNQ